MWVWCVSTIVYEFGCVCMRLCVYVVMFVVMVCGVCPCRFVCGCDVCDVCMCISAHVLMFTYLFCCVFVFCIINML